MFKCEVMMVKRLTTKELFAESLMELLEVQQLTKITVGAISKNCGMSSRTFYNNFLDKYDLINWIYVHRIEEAYEELGVDVITWRELVDRMVTTMSERETFFKEALADRTDDINLTETSVNRGLDLLMQYIDKKAPGKGQDEVICFHTAMYFHGVSAMLLKWLRDGRVASKDQIVNYCVDAMPDILKPFLGE